MTPTRADIYYSAGARAGVEDCVARMRAKALEYTGTDAARVLLAFADDLEAGLVDKDDNNDKTADAKTCANCASLDNELSEAPCRECIQGKAVTHIKWQPRQTTESTD
jgi:hypothetical protein